MKKTIHKTIFAIFLIAIGCFIIAFAYNAFNAKSGVLIGGLSGICIIVTDFINAILGTNISFVVLYLFLNLCLILLAFKYLGKKFAIYTLIGMSCYSIFIELCTFAQNIGVPSDDLFLCAIFSGVLIGLGIGITIKYGGSTGGSDIIACVISKKNSKIGIGTINFMINAVVIVLAIVTDGFTLALYGLICIYLTGLMTDFILQGSQGVNAYYIVSRKSKEIAMKLISKMDLRITAFHSTALTTNEEIDVLCCVVRMNEVNALKGIIYECDQNAFVFATKINEAMNKGFSKLEDGSTLISKLLHKRNSYFKGVKALNTKNDNNNKELLQNGKEQETILDNNEKMLNNEGKNIESNKKED